MTTLRQAAEQALEAVKQIAEALRKHGLTLVKTAHSYHVMDLGRIEAQTTSPPASKPWVGLTDEEMRDLEKQFNAERVRTSDEEYLVIYPGDYWAWQRAIEAKLREKNT